jgi:hypothetical protein
LQWFRVFLGVFASVLDTCLKYFICLLCILQLFASGCFKSRSGDAHRMRVGSDWQRRRHPRRRKDVKERHEPAVGVLAREPNALGCSLANWAGTIRR